MQHAQSLSFNTSLGSTWMLSTDYVANMMVNCDQTAGAQALDAEKQLQFVKIAPAEILIIDMTSPLNRRLVETYNIVQDAGASETAFPFHLKFGLKSNPIAIMNITGALQGLQWTGTYPLLDLSDLFIHQVSPDLFVFATRPIESPMQPFIHASWKGTQEWWLNNAVDTTMGLDTIRSMRGNTITAKINPTDAATCGQITLTTVGVYLVSACWLLEMGTSQITDLSWFCTTTIEINGTSRMSSVDLKNPGGKISGAIFVDYADLPATLILTIKQVNTSSTNLSLKTSATLDHPEEYSWITITHIC